MRVEGNRLLIELVGELTEKLVAVARIGKLAAAERIGRLPIHVEELLHESDGPFGTEDRTARRWLVTSCLAGAACTLVAGAAALGILGSDSNGGGAFASIQPFNSASLSPLKSDIGGKSVEIGIAASNGRSGLADLLRARSHR